LSVRYFGLGAIREAIEGGMRLAEHAEKLVRARPELEVLSPAQFGILCFRLRGEDALNERVNSRVNETGRFLISSTRLRGAFSLRMCTHNWRTSEADIEELIDLIVIAGRD
jgi:aromatic-L-amino-acid/L-tryptophan decarboxylase